MGTCLNFFVGSILGFLFSLLDDYGVIWFQFLVQKLFVLVVVVVGFVLIELEYYL